MNPNFQIRKQSREQLSHLYNLLVSGGACFRTRAQPPSQGCPEPWPTPSVSTWPQPDAWPAAPARPPMFIILTCQALNPPSPPPRLPARARPAAPVCDAFIDFSGSRACWEPAPFSGALIAGKRQKAAPLSWSVGRPRLFLLLTHSVTLDASRLGPSSAEGAWRPLLSGLGEVCWGEGTDEV